MHFADFVADLSLGAIAGTRDAGGPDCDLILAVNWVNVREALRGIDWYGRILIDATTSHMDPKPDISLAGPHLGQRINGQRSWAR